MVERRIKIAPSVLAADFSHLATEVGKVERAGADLLHVDVMDGHFVPNITIGPGVIEAIRPETRLPIEAHLMIDEPAKFINSFALAGSDIITVHLEAAGNALKRVIRKIKALKVKAGIALNPTTPLSKLKENLKGADLVLLMTVNPGFGGQRFIESVLPKIRDLSQIYKGDIEVDGGINSKNAGEVLEAGANILACGTYIFKSKDYRAAIESLRKS